MPHLQTPVLDIAFEQGGPPDGRVVMLLHGWPDDVRGWDGITPMLERRGYRWVAPWLRGFGPTTFRDAHTLRDGSAVAIAQDAFDLADVLGIELFAVVGHDWGGRAAYHMGALAPDRIVAMAVLAIGYAPGGEFVVPSFAQCARWWYQWLMTSDAGVAAVRADPIGFAQRQWDTWSPPGWYGKADFDTTARSFANDDWVDITLHGYRSRWQPTPLDDRYAEQRATIASIRHLRVPTLMIQGADDRCDPPGESEGLDDHFERGYERVVVPGVGHFPAREAADVVGEHIIRVLSRAG